MQPAVEFIYATAFIVMIGAIIVFVFSYKKKLNDTAVCVYATVTHLWDPSSDLPSGFREHSFRVFAKWINPQTQIAYYFVKESSQPLEYRMGDFVPATINPEHPWFRYLNI
jgi:hypothetical protein